MLTVYTPVPGDILVPDFGGPALTVQSVSTVAARVAGSIGELLVLAALIALSAWR